MIESGIERHVAVLVPPFSSNFALRVNSCFHGPLLLPGKSQNPSAHN